jgi:hypothetical protein
MVLPDAQVGVRNMGQFHGWRMGPKAVKSKKLRGADRLPLTLHMNHRFASARESPVGRLRLLH